MTVNEALDFGIIGKSSYVHRFVTSGKKKHRRRLKLLINSERRNFISAGRKLRCLLGKLICIDDFLGMFSPSYLS